MDRESVVTVVTEANHGVEDYTLELRYDLADPLVVGMTFGAVGCESVEWRVAREMLFEGLVGRTGIGDVQFWPYPENKLAIWLENDEWGTYLTASANDVRVFLRKTEMLLPLGQEEELIFAELDRDLAELL